MRKKLFSIAAAATLLAAATPATAATIWLDSPGCCTEYATGAGRTFTDGSVTVRATAWSINNADIINPGKLGVWPDGLGVNNAYNDGSHTVDNSGYLDFIVLQFDTIVELENARFNTNTAWGFNDTDATIGYGLSGIPYTTSLGLTGQPASFLNSFNLYSSNSPGNGSNTRNINPGGNVGNVWLIGASFNNPSEPYRTYYKKYLDGFKLEKVTYSVPPPAVPEPSTWAMMLLGFGLIGGAMRTAKGKKERIAFRSREGAFEAA